MKYINISSLRGKRNLLAFSAGTDSSALAHFLFTQNISFDLIHVNYHTRPESDKETELAAALQEAFSCKLFVKHFSQPVSSNFEKVARDFRHSFFESHMDQYDNLITGHNLNDKVEWLLMQFTRGAGSKELFGMEPSSFVESSDKSFSYNIVRPLLSVAKEDILSYLDKFCINHFVDSSNASMDYTRNQFRHKFSDQLVSEFKEGIRSSFNILNEELNSQDLSFKYLIKDFSEMYFNIQVSDIDSVFTVANRYLKSLGYLMSGPERSTLKDTSELNFILNKKCYVLCIAGNLIYIAPYLTNITMSKPFKNAMRGLNIPIKIRPFLFVYQS